MNTTQQKPAYYRFEDIEIGQEASLSRTISKRDVELFTEISQDFNPLHFDDEYARREQFDGRIIPGLLTTSFISRLIGMLLPGKQALYRSQEVTFKKPVYIGDTLVIKGTVMEKIAGKKNIIVLKTEIINQNGIVVLSGSAKVIVRK